MLISFSVENFRSFGAEQTLNMVASALKDHSGHCVPIADTGKSVLQVGVVYGANAAGKSNLVKAILFAQMLIAGKAQSKRLALNHFRFAKRKKPVSFEFRFLADGQVFVYGFKLTPDKVVGEWLDAMSAAGHEANVFTREKQDIKIGRLRAFGKDGAAPGKALKLLKELGVREDQLFLNKIVDLPASHRSELLNRAVWWFTQCLTVIEAEAHYQPLIDFLDAGSDFCRFSAAFLSNVGTGISDLHIDRTRIDAEKLPKSLLEELQAPKGQQVTITIGGPGVTLELDSKDPAKIVRKNLVAKHHVSGDEYPIAFQDESDGTQRCLNLLPALYHLTQACKVFVVDEFDRSLHPLLCHALLKLFLDACPGGCQQMIVTTHETHLLDQDLLRRDEIWFVEKDGQQQTRLSSLGDWKVRNDLKIEKGYLQGRFGGIPFIGDTKKLMDLIQCPANGKPHEKKTPS